MAITGTLMSVNYLFLYKALECLTQFVAHTDGVAVDAQVLDICR